MKTTRLLALFGSAALLLISTVPALAGPGDPIPGTEVGLEGDPPSIRFGTTETDSAGKFQFKGLKAGKYKLVVSPAGSKTTVRDGAQLQLQRVFRITNVRANANLRVEGTTALVGDVILIPVNPRTGRSDQAIVIPMDGGTISGTLRIADNESPRPQDRKLLNAGANDRQNVTTVVGKFVSYKSGILTLRVSAMEGEEPKLTEFGPIPDVDVQDTRTPDGRAKTLPADEAFRNLKVGTLVKIETNMRGQIIGILIGLLKTENATHSGANVPNDAWRYKQHNGERWFYGADKKWLVYRNGKWIRYAPTSGTSGTRQKTNLSGNNSADIFDRWGQSRTSVAPGARTAMPSTALPQGTRSNNAPAKSRSAPSKANDSRSNKR